MLNILYHDVSIQYITQLSDASELKDLLFNMKIINQNEDYIYQIEIDEQSSHVNLKLSSEGYNYINNKTFNTFEVTFRKAVFHLLPV